MRALIQRVNHASVTILPEGDKAGTPAEPYVSGAIEKGFLILLGVGQNDGEEQAERLWSKISKLRIFEDEAGKTNVALGDIAGQVLVVSQFTLYADCKRGNRPSFTSAGAPDAANELYEYFCDLVQRDTGSVQKGVFGAHMQVDLQNDGPFTIWLDTDQI